ncbi:MAG: 4-alpha-glucanotransferase [Acidobacteriota bacterium]
MKNNNHSRFERGSGVLLHITSLPGEHGIGNLGKSAFDFVDYLKSGGQKYWQILPAGPVSSGYSFSPYSSYSSFAGNQLFIDPVSLQKESWMHSDIVSDLKHVPDRELIDFQETETSINNFLQIAWINFKENAISSEKDNFEQFCENNKHWLNNFSLFRSISGRFNSFDWRSWGEGLKIRENGDIKEYSALLAEEIRFVNFEQYIFDLQWRKLKNYCKNNNIRLIGDIPIYAGMDSADVWANTGIFQFNDNLEPEGVAGVPPDYFSETGQKWGNPLYKWFSGDKTNTLTLDWWLLRMRRLLELVDIVRIDHFRGFESYWSVEPDSVDGRNGKWVTGPGKDLFDFLKKSAGNLPVIAEDLGIITDEVNKLREETGFPGMKILQFAFDQQPDNPYIPENITDPNSVIYTGTHDNNTSAGWFANEISDIRTKEYIRSYLKLDKDEDFLWKFIECSISSIADISIVPLQDILGLGEGSRLNTPGTSGSSNWRWKTIGSAFENTKMEKLKKLCERHGRL